MKLNQIKKTPTRSSTKPITIAPNKIDRIQKVLANLGVGSRREIEGWIKEQRLFVNNKLANLGDKITGKESIRLDKKTIWPKQTGKTPSQAHSYFKSRHKPTYEPEFEVQTIIYHKPIGEICTNLKETDRVNVFSRLPKPKQGKWIMVGRLDLNTSGLLLFTNYGELAHRLMHPSYEMPRSYFVRVLGNHDTKKLVSVLLKGVVLEDGRAKLDSIEPLKDDAHSDSSSNSDFDEKQSKKVVANRWYLVTLHEGRNREVRRLFESQGLKVSRLVRTGFGGITLPRLLKAGKTQQLTTEQQKELMARVKL